MLSRNNIDLIMESRLSEYLQSKHPDWSHISISEMEQIEGGWESDIYSLRLEYDEAKLLHSENLILRMYPGIGGASDKAANEFRAISLVARSGYPVPHVHLLETLPEPLGKPFILMEKIPGKMMWTMMAEAASKPELDALVNLFGNLMARLHQIDWRAVVPNPDEYEPGTPTGVIDRLLSRYRRRYSFNRLEGFDVVLDWLERHKQAAAGARAVVVHSDFHPMNIIVPPRNPASPETYPEGVVIDWTGIDITDARYDLAWALMLAYAYQPDLRDLLLHAYEREIGTTVTNLDYFDVVACFRRLFDIALSLTNGAESTGMRPGAENIMRAQSEQINRMLGLLADRTGIHLPLITRMLNNHG